MLNYTLHSPDFDPLLNLLRDPDPVLDEFGDYLVDRTKARINFEGVDPYGGPYAPLTADYEERKGKRYGYDRPILKASGAMLLSLRAFPATSGRLVIAIGGAASYHQRGTGRVRKRLIFPTSDRGLPIQDQAALTAIVEKHIRAAIAR